jgi:hypothetical protein
MQKIENVFIGLPHKKETKTQIRLNNRILKIKSIQRKSVHKHSHLFYS